MNICRKLETDFFFIDFIVFSLLYVCIYGNVWDYSGGSSKKICNFLIDPTTKGSHICKDYSKICPQDHSFLYGPTPKGKRLRSLVLKPYPMNLSLLRGHTTKGRHIRSLVLKPYPMNLSLLSGQTT